MIELGGSGFMFVIVTHVSTWPWTMCPDRRWPTFIARSRLTLEFMERSPRFVRRSVSGDIWNFTVSFVSSVAVKQMPAMNMIIRIFVY